MIHPINFRDVGEAVELVMDRRVLLIGTLFRGGKFDELAQLEELGTPRTIINLRRGPDPKHFQGVRYVAVPADDSVENYDTQNRKVRKWLKQAIQAVAEAEPPTYLHCTSGKDRTGVVVAGILSALDIPDAAIIEEYALSTGVQNTHIAHALKGLAAFELSERTVQQLRRVLLEAA